MPLTATEITDIRGAFQTETLQDTATISRKTDTPDGQGGKTNTWTVIATGVPARLGPASRLAAVAEGAIAGRVGATTPVAVNVPALQDITLRDRVTILGRVLEVVELSAPRSWEFTREVICREVL